MQQYFATYWNGASWEDLHADPLPFEAARDMATSVMLSGSGMTRLRPADQPDPLTTISAEQIEALYVYAQRYGGDWKHYLAIEWQCGTAPSALHRLRIMHGPSWLEGFNFPPVGLR